ncbi:MAG: LysM peptidoglycan-binding domain-containing protein [Anaerolineaceae bacterium]|nr:LysM peptidoglycan-binding domain-containing protein [Anaerolineaceae bacterium]
MQPKPRPLTYPLTLIVLLPLALAIACVRSSPASQGYIPILTTPAPASTQPAPAATRNPYQLSTRAPGAPILTPTPDAPRLMPTARTESESYTVRYGDSLGKIAQRYGVTLQTLIEANNIANPNLLEVGVILTIPAPNPLPPGPNFKIIPDSELVYGPTTIQFSTADFIQKQGGYLARHYEEVEDVYHSGADVVIRVAREYSVNPRLLLALLEYQSGWVTQSNPSETAQNYPMGYINPYYDSLYMQLAWGANNLNRGYYLWKANGITGWILADGQLVPPAPTLNPGTAGVQHFFSLLYGQSDWERAVSGEGLFAVYQSFYGYPFDLAFEPLIPDGLQQPEMQLPFEPGKIWSFTGGPHGGWGNGSAWAGLDFAPPGDALGCVSSNEWVVALADGLILRAENGAVVQDLDGDGFEQTGWTILYMHIETRDRIAAGLPVKAGDRIGHPSCEGGISNGTHVHIARRYNGEWIAADASLPFELDGWVSSGDGIEYNGFLTRNGASIEAWDARKDENQIGR